MADTEKAFFQWLDSEDGESGVVSLHHHPVSGHAMPVQLLLSTQVSRKEDGKQHETRALDYTNAFMLRRFCSAALRTCLLMKCLNR